MKKGFTIIGSIPANVMLAAISDGEHTEVQVEGRTDEIIQLSRSILLSVAECLHHALKDEHCAEAKDVIVKDVATIAIEAVYAYFDTISSGKEDEEENE